MDLSAEGGFGGGWQCGVDAVDGEVVVEDGVDDIAEDDEDAGDEDDDNEDDDAHDAGEDEGLAILGGKGHVSQLQASSGGRCRRRSRRS